MRTFSDKIPLFQLYRKPLINESPKNEQPWPEEIYALPDEPELEQIENTPMGRNSKLQTASVYKTPVGKAKKMPMADCDRGGSKFARGRLAWMECYYRMDVEK